LPQKAIRFFSLWYSGEKPPELLIILKQEILLIKVSQFEATRLLTLEAMINFLGVCNKGRPYLSREVIAASWRVYIGRK
jgi:hypothetical protein